MLILGRRPGETIVIEGVNGVADNIKVTVLGVKGNQVRLGIDAPKDVTIHRQEISDKIHQHSLLLHSKENVPILYETDE